MKIFALFLAIFALMSSAVAFKNAVCGLKPAANGDGIETGLAYKKRWSYNSATNECFEFVFGGWGGNDNRFKTKQECEDKCKEKNLIKTKKECEDKCKENNFKIK